MISAKIEFERFTKRSRIAKGGVQVGGVQHEGRGSMQRVVGVPQTYRYFRTMYNKNRFSRIVEQHDSAEIRALRAAYPRSRSPISSPGARAIGP